MPRPGASDAGDERADQRPADAGHDADRDRRGTKCAGQGIGIHTCVQPRLADRSERADQHAGQDRRTHQQPPRGDQQRGELDAQRRRQIGREVRRRLAGDHRRRTRRSRSLIAMFTAGCRQRASAADRSAAEHERERSREGKQRRLEQQVVLRHSEPELGLVDRQPREHATGAGDGQRPRARRGISAGRGRLPGRRRSGPGPRGPRTAGRGSSGSSAGRR